MQINVSGQHIEVTPALRAYVTEKLQRISRHFDHVISIDVILRVENHHKQAEGKVNAAGKSLFAQDSNDDMYAAIEDDKLLDKLLVKGIDKFIAYEIPVDKAKKRYGGHFHVVVRDLNESDDLRILDYQGGRAFSMFSFSELGEPHKHEPEMARFMLDEEPKIETEQDVQA